VGYLWKLKGHVAWATRGAFWPIALAVKTVYFGRLPDTLVQLLCLSSSDLIARRYEYERTTISRCALFIGIGVINEQRTNWAEQL
jgi:hypothetical protein